MNFSKIATTILLTGFLGSGALMLGGCEKHDYQNPFQRAAGK